MASNSAYLTTEDELNNEKSVDINLSEKGKSEKKAYNYEDALELTGSGCYTYTILSALSCAILAMGMDMFGFSVVVAGCACEFDLTTIQKSIMMSMPFLGPVFMSYPWGYVSDTQGRRKSLIVAMCVSFILSVASAFSNSWVMLAAFRFLSTSFCSCAQSSTYVLLGESCQEKARGFLMLVMTSLLMFNPPLYFLIGYFTLNLEFSYDIGITYFVPWRMLTLLLALPLGISAIALMFIYESPKFTLNMGLEKEALDDLKKIYQRNGGDVDKFPVKKLYLLESGNERKTDVSLWQSMKQQTLPLFKPPLLMRTLKLYFLTMVAYSTNNGFLMWFPFIVNAFFTEMNSLPLANGTATDPAVGLCDIILKSQSYSAAEDYVAICTPKLELLTSLTSIAHGCIYAFINIGMSWLASRKKALCMSIFLISAVSGLATALVRDNAASLVLFLSFLLTGLATGLISTYFVSLFPTSYRGMAACLGVMVARTSALFSTNVVGAVIMTDCKTTLYTWSVYVFSAFIVTCFLPADRPKKQV